MNLEVLAVKRISIPAAFVALLLLGVYCDGLIAAEEVSPLKVIEEANSAFAAAYNKGDAKAVAEMYTPMGQLFPPNSDIVEGRLAIQRFWQSVMDDGISRLELKTIEVEPFGDSIVESGRATLFGKDGAVLDRGKYLVLWKKAGGKWKLHRDCWNSSQPLPKN
jgi:uncharacterized protein (TIGR02246 family)